MPGDYYRALDHHGVLHLARADMDFGTALCGSPPAGVQLTDPILRSWAPGENVNQQYDLLCPICNYRKG